MKMVKTWLVTAAMVACGQGWADEIEVRVSGTTAAEGAAYRRDEGQRSQWGDLAKGWAQGVGGGIGAQMLTHAVLYRFEGRLGSSVAIGGSSQIGAGVGPLTGRTKGSVFGEYSVRLGDGVRSYVGWATGMRLLQGGGSPVPRIHGLRGSSVVNVGLDVELDERVGFYVDARRYRLGGQAWEGEGGAAPRTKAGKGNGLELETGLRYQF